MQFTGFKNLRYKKFHIDEYNNKTTVDGSRSFALDEVKEWNDGLGIVVPEGCVVIDVDDMREAEALYQCVNHLNIKTLVSKSTRGMHFYFRIPTGMKIKNLTGISVPLGLIHVDYRSGQSTSLIIEYRNGKWSEWLIAPSKDFLDPYQDLDELPYFLFPLKTGLNPFIGMGDGDGRNNTLNAHRSRLVALCGYDQLKVKELFNLINTYVFAKPLDRKELETLAEFREIDKKDRSERWFENKKFLHNVMGDFLMENMSVYRDEANQTYYFNNEYYTMDDRAIEEKIVELCPTLVDRERKEVVKYVKLAKIKQIVEPAVYHNWVCCKNGLVDALNGNTMGFTPAIFTTNQLNVNYDPNAYDQYVDKFLDEVLVECGDKEQRMIFEEYLGYTLLSQNNCMKKMLFMVGPNADNGKSTTIAMVQNLLTQENYTSLKLSQISEKNAHVLTALVDKKASFDDDADNAPIKGSTMAYLKTITSDNNKITINPKYAQPYQKFITAKFWIATNHIIKTEQKGNEWMTRLLLLSFDNRFTGERKVKFMTNHILERLMSANARSYLLKLAITGYQRLMKNGCFTTSQTSENLVKQYKIENDTVFKFLFSRKYEASQVADKTLKALYQDYKNFLEEEDITYSVSLNNFERRLLDYFDKQIGVEVIENERIIKLTK